VTLWGVRLTYNLARKGGYTGVETTLGRASRPNGPRASSTLQLLLHRDLSKRHPRTHHLARLHRISGPRCYALWCSRRVVVALFSRARSERRLPINNSGISRGETRRGRVRGHTRAHSFSIGPLSPLAHPNYFFELAMVGSFSPRSARGRFSVSVGVLGAFLLSVLFVGSTNFTEKITSRATPSTRTTSEVRRRSCRVL